MTDRATWVGRATLAFDDLLTHPDAAKIWEDLLADTPPWITDQFAATGRWIDRELHRAATATGQTVRALRAEQHPAWVRLGALSTLTGWIAGEGSTCLHSPHPERPPQPLVAAAWRPGLIACGQCSQLFELPPGSRTDRTCDGCGHLTAGIVNGDGIWPGIVQIGLLTYMFGCCSTCRYWPDEAGEAGARP